MAKNGKDKRSAVAGRPQDGPAASAPAGRFWRYSLVLVLVGLAALSWVSLLSYCPTDPPSQVMIPPKSPVDNVAGIVGAYIAHALLYWLGVGAYMALLFVTIAASLLAFGGRVRDLPWRMMGVVVLVTATSTAAYMWNPTRGSDLLNGSAGILGVALGELLLSRFSSTGGWIIVMVCMGIGLMLTADSLVLRIPGLSRKALVKSGELASRAGSMLPRFPRPAPAGAPAGGFSRGGRAAAASAGTAVADRADDAPAAAPARARPTARPAPAAKRVEPAVEAVEADEAPDAAADKAEAAGLMQRLVAVTKAKADKPARPPAPAKPSEPPQRERGDAEPTAKAGGPGGRGGNKPYDLPSANLLEAPTGGYLEAQEQVALQRHGVLQQTLNDFNVAAQVVGHQTGPVITLFELSLAPGVKVSQVSNLSTDIARALCVPGVRVVSPLPGRDTIGIEVPNMDKEIVRIRELMALAPDAEKKMRIPLYFGKDAGGGPIVADLAKMPHMLIAGTTGSGKSVCINAIIMAVLMTRRPEEVRMILVDPKMVEMAAFEDIPHLLCPIVNDMRKAEEILEWAATKMDERYEVLKEAGVKNIADFNKLSKEEIWKRFRAETDEDKAGVATSMPYYVIIVDELADLIMTSTKEVEQHIIRIAQKARAVGIHLILATQRPSANVVTGLIKSNMPCRVSFRVASRQESRIVLDQNGAEVLMGQGDMLFLKPGTSTLLRAQGTYVDDSEINTVVSELTSTVQQNFHPELMQLSAHPTGDGNGERDEMFDQAVEIVLTCQRGSVSLLQRRLAVGYSRASRIIDQMAEAGILGDYKGSQARECLMTLEDWQVFKDSIAADQSGRSAADGEPTSV